MVGDEGQELPPNQPGELVMRGPQFMLGYWHEPNATAGVLRDGWYWSGDIVSRDPDHFYLVLDRRKEMIKYKGFQVAPAEVEAVLLEHPAVRECGVVGNDRTSQRAKCPWLLSRCVRDLFREEDWKKNFALSLPKDLRLTSSPETSTLCRRSAEDRFRQNSAAGIASGAVGLWHAVGNR